MSLEDFQDINRMTLLRNEMQRRKDAGALPFPVAAIDARAADIGSALTLIGKLSADPGLAMVLLPPVQSDHDVLSALDDLAIIAVFLAADGAEVTPASVHVIPHGQLPSVAVEGDGLRLHLRPGATDPESHLRKSLAEALPAHGVVITLARDGGVDVSPAAPRHPAGHRVGKASLQFLESAIDVLPHAFALFDANDRLVTWNASYGAVNPASSCELREGMPFEEILRRDIEDDLFTVEPIGADASAWIAMRLADRKRDLVERELKMKDGRILRLLDRRIANGWRVNMLVDISDLRRSEIRLKSVMEAAQMAAWTRDLRTGEGEQSPEFFRMLGESDTWKVMSTAALIERTCPDDRPRMLGLLEACRRGEIDRFSTEFRMLHRDGRWVWIKSRGGVVDHDPDGTPRLLAGENIDVTSQRALKERLETVLDAARAGIWTANLADGSVMFDSGWYENLGYRPDDLRVDKIESFMQIVHPDDREHVRALHHHVLHGRRARFELQYRARHQLGHWVWILAVGGVIEHDIMGRPTIVAGVDFDITENKQLESRLENVISGARAGTWTNDLSTGWIEHNAIWHEMLGLGPEDPRVDTLGKFEALLHPEDLPRSREVFARIQSRSIDHFQIELRLRHASGRWVWVQATCGVTEHDTNGRPRILAGVSLDITSAKEMEAERHSLREDLIAAQRRGVLGMLHAGFAHDLNNLISVISGATDAMASGSGEEVRLLDILQNATSQAQALVGRFVRLGDSRPNRRLVDLRIAIREAADLIRIGLEPDVDLVLDVPDSPVMAMVDPTDIMQVVLNLGLNAREALDAGPQRIAISLTEASPEDLDGPFLLGTPPASDASALCLKVSDTGRGMEPAMLSRIFAPYLSGKEEQGRGLGLAMVRHIVLANHGALSVKSAPGLGTEFRILCNTAHGQEDCGAPTN